MAIFRRLTITFSHGTAARQRGFTLLELLVALLVFAILVTAATPAFNEFVRRQQMATTANDLVQALWVARSEAIRRGEYSAALYNLLAAMRPDGNYRNGQAEKVMNGLFELLGESDPLTQTYHQQMTAIAGG